MRNVAFIGFMGAGKSYYSFKIGKKLHFAVMDTDQAIVRAQGKTVAEIFAEQGEAHFRALERELLLSLQKRRRLVLSLGGGTLLQEGNAELIKPNFGVVLLDTPFETCLERVRRNTRRPLAVQSTDEQLYEMYCDRRQKYLALADTVVRTDRAEEQVIAQICAFMRKSR
ncbi:MAG: shikimate kinase [Clostridia bacterium]|nr:shikimate kinase [Clostridia bacterium]